MSASTRTAATLPTGCTVTLGPQCLTCEASLAVRLGELGIRPGATLTVGARVAGGARLVTVGACRYAIDHRTLETIAV